ncbi:hypothetical protein BGZ60DRAFT_392156 [Tricladium varicosporioides]|nr:hypothetical protein BGZ60DRAFT_392156 [Hymenoscyphus varicosporioides]
MAGVGALRGGGGQVVVGGGGGDGGDVEDVKSQCSKVEEEYHAFLAATVRFLHAIQERQMKWRWNGESGVFDGVGWMQGLWASRRANSQDRSFIEQQMALYGGTGCFGKSKEVLRRDVEIVEYLNDLMDLFE